MAKYRDTFVYDTVRVYFLLMIWSQGHPAMDKSYCDDVGLE